MNEFRVYGYLKIKKQNNPNKSVKYYSIRMLLKENQDFMNKYYSGYQIYYDWNAKIGIKKYRTYLEYLLDKVNTNDIIVVRSLFQLGDTKMDIYKSLYKMRAKQVRLAVGTWQVDIKEIMDRLLKVTLTELLKYENINQEDSSSRTYTYCRLSGYYLNDNLEIKEREEK